MTAPPERSFRRCDPRVVSQPLVVRSAAAAAFRSFDRFRTAFQKSTSDRPSPALMLRLDRLSIA